jgi:hypothetical protein
MVKYFFSRFLIVFLVMFFRSWIVNIDGQLLQFFDIDVTDGFFIKVLSWLLRIVVLVIGLVVLNSSYTVLRYTDELKFMGLIRLVRSKGIKTSIGKFFGNFVENIRNNIEHETEREMKALIFGISLLVFAFLTEVNPLPHNYYGLYMEYESEAPDTNGSPTVKGSGYIYNRNDDQRINNKMDELEYDPDRDDEYYEIEKHGYLFIQTGLIDGYQNYESNNHGFGGYISCLLIAALEHLIKTFVLFLLPFLVAFSIYVYREIWLDKKYGRHQ